MEKSGQPAIKPCLAVLLAVVAVSFSSIFTKLSSAPPLVIAFYRLLFTVALLAPLALNARGRREMAAMGIRDILLAVMSGAFLALHFAVWITSLNYTSISSSTVLVTMQPLFVITGGALFLGEKLPGSALAGAAVTIAGSVLVGVNDFQIGGRALFGDFLAFSGALFVAVYVLIGRLLRKKLSLFPYVFIVYSASAAILLPSCLLAGASLYPYPAGDWLCFLALAVVPTIFGHTVFNWALKYVRAAVVSVSILGEPAGATILALLIFQQVPGALQVIGGMVIIAGLFLFTKSASDVAIKAG
ncbi:MAG: DMT family transporter [Peptococcaceae bacterium]|nr:DMT family transporter [Peptococcaceae bacterium]